MMEAKEIVANEVVRQKEFGYEPSWEDFVIAGMEEGRREERERIQGLALAEFDDKNGKECVSIPKQALKGER